MILRQNTEQLRNPDSTQWLQSLSIKCSAGHPELSMIMNIDVEEVLM